MSTVRKAELSELSQAFQRSAYWRRLNDSFSARLHKPASIHRFMTRLDLHVPTQHAAQSASAVSVVDH